MENRNTSAEHFRARAVGFALYVADMTTEQQREAAVEDLVRMAQDAVGEKVDGPPTFLD